jgi:ABC-2 type transport system ATP-binding protein
MLVTTNPALSLQSVTKRYASKLAVDAATLDIPAGGIHGILGPNGAGKTTLIRMITRITVPDSGIITFLGEPLAERHQAQMGYMPEERGLYRKMKVGEQLQYLMQLRDMSSGDALSASREWLKRMELAEWEGRKVDDLSKGMQQKVQFIATVAHKPKLIILDEPFSGLDPLNSQLVEDVLHELCEAGATVLFSTHRMEQVEQLCASITLINDGKILLHDSVSDLRLQFRKNIYLVELSTVQSSINWPQGWQIVHQMGHILHLQVPQTVSPREMIAWLNENLELRRFEELLPTIREIFIDQVQATRPAHVTTPAHA